MPLSVVILSSLVYIALLFLTAWWVDRKAKRDASPVRNPYLYSLSMAVYCTAWTFFGSVGRAASGGLSFLAIYLGPTLIAPLWIFVLRKMIVICKHQRITSIADFISARYGKSASLASLVTIIAVLGIIPYISIQLKAVSTGIDILSGQEYNYFYPGAPFYADAAFWVTVAMAVFTALFGTRKLDPNERHEGLVAAIAFESLVKLIAFFAIGYFTVYTLFNGFEDLFQKAAQNPDVSKLFSLNSAGIQPTTWSMLLLLSALAILLLPRQFHIAVVENTHPRHVGTAMWLFPLYLLLINIFVLPVALAGKMLLGPSAVADAYVLSIPLEAGQHALALLVFLGGFSAAASMVVVESTALSIMVSNHLVVPLMLGLRLRSGKNRSDGARRLLDIRRWSILGVQFLAYIYLKAVGNSYDLVSVGLISFTAVAQFAPAALIGMYWKRATPQGATAGLITGFLIWAYMLPLPSIADAGYLPRTFETEGPFGLSWLRPATFFGLEGMDSISAAAFWSLLLNTAVYALVSLWTQPSALALTQADLFVQIHRYTAGQDYDLFKREAKLQELRQVMARFIGPSRVDRLWDNFEKRQGITLSGRRMAPPELIRVAETTLAGAIGAASGRIVIESIATQQPIDIEEVMKVLEQTQEVLRYSRELEIKSNELETTTQQLREANEQLKALDRLKADFITTVTHELRTPVTSIKALSKIILDYRSELDPQKLESYLQILVSESERISRLINQVLDLEKIQNPALKPFELIEIAPLIRQATASMEQLFAEKNVDLLVLIDNKSLCVSGNRDQLLQVLCNLLSNALKFTQAETGKIEVSVVGKAGQVIISVADNGIGIALEKQEFIFEKFTQVSNLATGKPQGSGLGLFITKTIVEQHQGQISVSSLPGVGSTFYIHLPELKQETT